MNKITIFSSLEAKRLWQLAVLAFGSGAIVMSLEIIASRILTPVFGSSTYTWGALIGVVLTGLSLGYFLGGRLADKNPRFEKICSVVFTGGLYIVFIPFLAPLIIGFSISTIHASEYSSLLATFVLLLFPSTLLGFVSPYVVKLGTNTLKKIGNISGNLYSISTVGSIIGTFVTVFVLIPSFEVRNIIFSLGIVLMTISIIGLRLHPKIIVLVIAIVLLTPSSAFVVGLMPHTGEVILEKETPYSHLDVVDSEFSRTLYLNGLRHSKMSFDDPTKLVLMYTKYFHFGKILNPDFEKVLFVGGGGFSGPRNFLDTYPNVQVDVVEIDPDVIDVAKQYFEIKDDPRLEIFNQDARKFLAQSDNKYDVIILDAFGNDYIPFHLLTKEYFELVEQKLKPDGVVILNMIGSLVGDTSNLVRAAYKTMNQSFPTVYAFLTYDNKAGLSQNVIFIGTKSWEFLSIDEISNLAEKNNVLELMPGTNFSDKFYDLSIITDDVPLLTDQFSPVSNLLNPISQPYITKSYQESNLPQYLYSENTAIIMGILLAIALFWPLHLRSVWKKHP